MFATLMTSLLSVGSPLLGMLTPPLAIEYMAIVPGLIVSVLAMLVILVDTFHRPGTGRDYLGYLGAVGLGVAGFAAYILWDNSLPVPTFHGMLYLDKFALFFAMLACLSGALAMLQAPAFMKIVRMDRGEFYMLVLFSVAGTIFMASAADLLAMFLALEVMSIPVYCLAGYLRRDGRSAEAAVKYFVLGAFSAGIMLYGVALIYGVTGTTNLELIGRNLSTLLQDPTSEAFGASQGLIVIGMLLILSGLAFKIAAVPFHVWTPDVYTGSPTPAVGYMSTAVKAGAVAALIRLCFIALADPALRGGFFGIGWVDVLFFLSAASMVLGNAVAVMQHNVKRMLAYSSIAHAGYILIGVCAAGARPEFFLQNDTVLFYLLSYTVGTVGAFGVLSVLGKNGKSVETYEDLAGLGLKYPFLGFAMAIFMFSSAGVPPLAGFVGKLYIFSAAVRAGDATGEFAFIGLAILGVLTSVAGAYYYLKVLVSMYFRKEDPELLPMTMEAHNGATFSIGLAALLTLLLGVVPGIALQMSREAVVDFKGAPASMQTTIDAGRQELERLDAAERAVEVPIVVPVEVPVEPQG